MLATVFALRTNPGQTEVFNRTKSALKGIARLYMSERNTFFLFEKMN